MPQNYQKKIREISITKFVILCHRNMKYNQFAPIKHIQPSKLCTKWIDYFKQALSKFKI